MIFARTGLLLLVLFAIAARADLVLVPDSSTIPPGGVIEATLFVANDSTENEVTIDVPARLTFRTRGVPAAPDIVLIRAPNEPAQASIKPGAYLRARYSGRLHEGLIGNLVLEPVDFEGPTLGISATQKAAKTEPPGDAPSSKEPAPVADAKERAPFSAIGPSDRDTARFITAFSPYEPNYFSIGSNGPTNAKFQVSLKFRLFNPDTQTPLLEKLYLAYSQTSIWEIGTSSRPFYDSAYRPSLFFLDEDVSQWPFRKNSRLGFQAGYEHESNGRDGELSRSFSIIFARPTVTFPIGAEYFVSVGPKIYGYVDDEDNHDIGYYRGHSDVLIKAGAIDGMQLATTLRKGMGRDPYSVQLDLSIPLKTARLGNLGGYLHLQYFNGYGETLLDYNRKVQPQFRIGLMITR
ncbi:MAG: phospholipase A [Betaproteobacteria bacterium]